MNPPHPAPVAWKIINYQRLAVVLLVLALVGVGGYAKQETRRANAWHAETNRLQRVATYPQAAPEPATDYYAVTLIGKDG